MKKILIISFLVITSLFFVNNVKAETKEFEFYNVEYDGNSESQLTPINVYSLVNQDILDNMEQKMVEYWEKNLKSHHPYYYIFIKYMSSSVSGTSYDTVKMGLTALKAIPIDYTSLESMSCNYNNYRDDSISFEDKIQLTYYYDYYNNDYHGYNGNPYGLYCDTNFLFNSTTDYNRYLSLFYYSSNYNQPFGLDDTYVVKNGDDILFTLNKQDYIPTYKDVFVDNIEDNYIEVDLNNYAYIALSLKDYSVEPFTSNVYVKGEYCISSVYDYGLKSKEEYDSSVTDVCSPYYDNYTPVRTYVTETDIKNHAIYYIKAHDTTKENKIKVDTSIFNIHYITEEEADNPILNINGKNYSTIPFDELPSNSIKNTDEGNWPGESEKFSFSDIFTSPLEFLKDLWSSIVNVFSVINEFISLLPIPLQTFLYLSLPNISLAIFIISLHIF